MNKTPSSPVRRSEKLRNKKSGSWRPLKTNSGKRKKLNAAPAGPPVLARNPAPSTSAKDFRPARKTRRRYDLTLSTPGVEMRLPAIPRVHIGWRLVSFLLLSAFSFGLYTLWTSSQFRVPAAQVIGLQRISSEAVNTVLGISGEPVFALDANQMELIIQDEFPEFSEAHAQVALPNSVVITVTERVPVLIWLQDDRTNLVDQNGITFPMRMEMESESLALPVIEAETSPPAPPSPLDSDLSSQSTSIVDLGILSPLEPGAGLDGFTSRPLLTTDMVSAVLLMAKNAPPEALLTYTADHGLVWKDKRGWLVYFGAPRDMDMKLKVYRAILDHTKTQDTRPEVISVEFISAPYYRIAG